MSGLDYKPQIWKLANDLGIKPADQPVANILHSVRKKISAIAKKYHCDSLRDLLAAAAGELGTIFREIHSDADLDALISEYVAKGEKIFANLRNELRDQDYAITLKRQRAAKWEAPFVSIIDCRGDKLFRAYFSKWHEIAHLLTLTPQTRLSFRRTHAAATHDPEEALMDIIAGEIGFWDSFLKVPQGEISFEAMDRIRQEYCPEASRHASEIGIVKALPQPCILAEAKLGLRKREEEFRSQLALTQDMLREPVPVLRAVHVTVNQSARDAGIRMHKNWRVPAHSVITRVFENGGYAEARENLDWWVASGGGRLSTCQVVVKARSTGESVIALLIPRIQ